LARRPISQIRGRNKFRRRPGNREPRSITLIVCEGESEQAYFDAIRLQLKLLTTEVVIPRDQGGLAPISVVEYAEDRGKERGGYDHIFCVFDRDQHESFNRARAKIRSLATRSRNPLAIREVTSAPCFEIWVLLHFELTHHSLRAKTSSIEFKRTFRAIRRRIRRRSSSFCRSSNTP